jgi:hypothetical protein
LLEGGANNEQKVHILVTDKDDEHFAILQLQDKRRCETALSSTKDMWPES